MTQKTKILLGLGFSRMVANYDQPQVFRRLQLKEEEATIQSESLENSDVSCSRRRRQWEPQVSKRHQLKDEATVPLNMSKRLQASDVIKNSSTETDTQEG